VQNHRARELVMRHARPVSRLEDMNAVPLS
jgi:hypothetical protein